MKPQYNSYTPDDDQLLQAVQELERIEQEYFNQDIFESIFNPKGKDDADRS